MNYNKNCVKLLPLIEQFERYSVFYTEFDGNYEVGDKLYIMVIDSGSTEYNLDSFQSSSVTYHSIGYELLKKDDNKITLNINYNDLILSGITELNIDNCYIGRVYIKNGLVRSGVINGTMLYNVSILPTSTLSLLWYQGIVAKSPNNIERIDFNTNRRGELILKSELTPDNKINSYYTINNNEIGLSIVNLFDDTITLRNCNINAGIINNCEIQGSNNFINNGYLNNCFIGSTYSINGGTLKDCILSNNTVKWNNGEWNSSWTGATIDIPTNPFRTLIWSNGTWRDGIFPSSANWENGRFVGGEFNGAAWLNGSFGTTKTNPLFNNTNWEDGDFNNGEFIGGRFKNGRFNNGKISNSDWENGIFNDGEFINSTWEDGVFNFGVFSGSTWENGIFNGGTFIESTWKNGEFNNGNFLSNSVWEDGFFYDGKFEDSTWKNGRFYKGSMFNSGWEKGDLFFGVMNNIIWSGGTWHNGIANNVEFNDGLWKNGIFNFGYFYKGKWENGSFNSGFFSGKTSPSDAEWHYGNFYFGVFNGVWEDGTFYTGDDLTTSIPSKDIIGKEYIQYNESGLFSTRYETVKLPAKRKF